MQRHNYVWEYFHRGSCANGAAPAPHWDSLIHSTTQFRHLEIVVLDAIIWIVLILDTLCSALHYCPYDILMLVSILWHWHSWLSTSITSENKQITNAFKAFNVKLFFYVHLYAHTYNTGKVEVALKFSTVLKGLRPGKGTRGCSVVCGTDKFRYREFFMY